jgi:hypothetical protein
MQSGVLGAMILLEKGRNLSAREGELSEERQPAEVDSERRYPMERGA